MFLISPLMDELEEEVLAMGLLPLPFFLATLEWFQKSLYVFIGIVSTFSHLLHSHRFDR